MALPVDPHVQAFVQRCQDQGFDPATAFVLYQELNAVGAPVVINEALASGIDQTGVAMLTRFQQALSQVNSPADWDAYCQNWAACACDVAPEAVTTDVKKAFVRSMSASWGQWVPQETSTDLRDRLVSMAFDKGLERHRDAAEGMTWERLAQVVQTDRMAMFTTGVPTSVSTTSQDDLQAALQTTSVRSIRWNWIDGDGDAQRAHLAHGLHRAQAELHARTRWEGPVLGLNGQMRLSFGNEHAATGYAMPTQDGSTMIVTSPRAAWGVVSHEWFHALDQVLVRDLGETGPGCLSDEWDAAFPIRKRGTPVQQQTIQAFNALLHTLMVEQPGPTVRKAGLESSQERWHQRILAALPWAGPVLEAEQQRLNDGTWTRATSAQAWEAGYLEQGRAPVEARTLAETMVSEVEFLRTAQANADQGGSIWREYLDHFNQNLIRLHRQNGEASAYEGYFQEPAEALAHSFEATFGAQDTSITDVHAGQAPLRYPTAEEGRWQGQAWATFFQSTAPGWRRLAGLSDLQEHEGPQALADSTSQAPTVLPDRPSPPTGTAGTTTTRLLNLAQLGARLVQRDQRALTAENDTQVLQAARQPRVPGRPS